MNELTYSIGELDIILRLTVALILALLIWLEREYKNQPAWVRTHILICLGSTLFMIISILLPEMYNSSVSDPGRIAAQVVSWVWFLWAWAIMKIWLNTKWLTTAANIWATAAIWLAVWAGLFLVASITTVFILINLILVERFKNKLVSKKRFCQVELEFKKGELNNKIMEQKLSIIPMNIMTKNIKEDMKKTDIKIIAKIDNNFDISQIHSTLSGLKGLTKISIWEYVK